MRLKEIEERLAAIKNELTTRATELKEEEITALENEVTALQEERTAIKAAAEKRSALLARIAAGESVGDGEGDGVGSTFFGFELGVESESASFSKIAETSTSCMDSPSLSVRVASVTPSLHLTK